MFDQMFNLMEEADHPDGAVRRTEFDLQYVGTSPFDRDKLESLVYAKTAARHRYITAKGLKAIVWYDKRGRACASALKDISDGELAYVAKSLNINTMPGTVDAATMGGESPQDHGYIRPVTEELAIFGVIADEFIEDAREQAASIVEARRPGKSEIKRQAKQMLDQAKKPGMGDGFLKMVMGDLRDIVAGHGDPDIRRRNYAGWTLQDIRDLLRIIEDPANADRDHKQTRSAAPNDPFDGPAPSLEKVRKFASMIQGAMDAYFKKQMANVPGYSRSANGGLVTVRKRRKFIAVDIGGSGQFLVGPNDYVWGIKGYGKVHKGKLYGTVDQLLQSGLTFNRGGLIRATPGMREEESVPEFDVVPWDHIVEYKQHRNARWSQGDSERHQTSLKRNFVDMAPYDVHGMSAQAKEAANVRAIKAIAAALQQRSDGITYVRDPGDVLNPEEVKQKVPGYLLQAAASGYPHGSFDVESFSVMVKSVNGRSSKGLMIKMQKPFPQICEKAHKGRQAG